ncbi:MAG: PASTA domain-containing protein [Tannerella sp.]|jgi:cell division protein FtsI (penicillin-binding protein 3)|nr:PASTA domain-containing protein [Tannerella sp.]
MASKDKTNNSRIALIRYFLVIVLILPFIVGISGFTFKIAFGEKEKWTKEAERYKLPNRLINPTRGDIYSADGKIMATTMPRYYLYIDFQADGFSRDTFLHSKRNGIDSLSIYLSRHLKNRTADGYKKHLIRGLNSKSRHYPVYEAWVSYDDLRKIQQFPFFRQGRNRSGLYENEIVLRQKLFGRLSSRMIGDIEPDIKDGLSKGKNGLEMYHDSLLRGRAGVNAMWRVGGKWTNVAEVEPVDGYDVVTTIDIPIQDFTEKALIDKLREVDGELGIAIVMEVKTGEIKAMSNLVRTRAGEYVENFNHAVADEIEPGSTFKIASMMVALEDNICSPDDTVDVGHGFYKYGNRTITDHNAGKDGYGKISVAQTIWYSSNVGVAKTILKGYEQNPGKFVEGLNKIGINDDLKLEIPGAGRAKIKNTKDRTWSRMSLPWMSFGYEVQVPPIQTLAFYNAIANDGKMIRPVFTKEIRKDGKTIKRFSTETIRSSICSRKTLDIIRDMMLHVVEDGTGKPFSSKTVTFAGKTGTAQIASGGKYSYSHNLSFCGFFPADKPQYTCFVLIRRPRIGYPSGAMPGSVFKNIAEKIYSSQNQLDIRSVKIDSTEVKIPSVKNGNVLALRNVLNELDIKNNVRQVESQYARVEYQPDNDEQISFKEIQIISGLVPNVVGMGAKDAVFAMEQAGLRVNFVGRGKVVSQSIAPGLRVNKGQTVGIELR